MNFIYMNFIYMNFIINSFNFCFLILRVLNNINNKTFQNYLNLITYI